MGHLCSYFEITNDRPHHALEDTNAMIGVFKAACDSANVHQLEKFIIEFEAHNFPIELAQSNLKTIMNYKTKVELLEYLDKLKMDTLKNIIQQLNQSNKGSLMKMTGTKADLKERIGKAIVPDQFQKEDDPMKISELIKTVEQEDNSEKLKTVARKIFAAENQKLFSLKTKNQNLKSQILDHLKRKHPDDYLVPSAKRAKIN